MRIGINAQILTDGRTGVTRFARNIIRALPAVGSQHEFIILGNRNDVDVERQNVKLVPTSPIIDSSSKRILWEQLALPRLLRSCKIDTMFYPDFAAPYFAGNVRSVVTFHDMTPFAVPSTFNRIRGYYKRLIMRNSGRSAERIITGSASTKRALLNFLPACAEDKICVVPYGIDSSMRREDRADELQNTRQRYGIKQPFILTVSALEARKNIVGLVRAFAQGKSKYRWPHALVLAGSPGYGYEDILSAVRAEKIEESVAVTGYVRDEDLPALYTLADAFIYPSFYEGFGFPPLEAMKCGCPVIVSRTTSLPEVVGDAGIFINPYQPEDIAEGINAVLSDHALRTDLQRKGIERTRLFTWEKTARGILDAISPL
jgi:glycosyltransferase involved in cell wall biosynthesis